MKVLHIGNEKMWRITQLRHPFTESVEVVNAPLGLTEDAYAQMAPDTEVIIVDAITEISEELMEKLPALKMIHSEGVAFNKIDLAAAGKRGNLCLQLRGHEREGSGRADASSDARCSQKWFPVTGLVRDGRQMEVKMGYMGAGSLKELADCKVGLIGFGAIGKATADMLHAFGVTVYYTKRHRLDIEEEARYQVQYLPMDELLKTCDMLSLHVPVTEETTGMCDREFFAKCRKGSYFVNTSRGELVDDDALREALENGTIVMAGLDTLDHEPVQKKPSDAFPWPEETKKRSYSARISAASQVAALAAAMR